MSYKALYIPIGLFTYPYTMYQNHDIICKGNSNRYVYSAIGFIALWPAVVPLTYLNKLESLIEKYF